MRGTDPDLGGTNVTDVSVVGFRIENQSGPGIRLMFTDHCRILSNSVNNTGAQSIFATRSTFTVIADNTLSNGTRGVEMTMRSSDNTVKENVVFGVFASENTVKENRIVGNGVSTIGTKLTAQTIGNVVKENVFNDTAIDVRDPTTGNNTVIGNLTHRKLRCPRT